ncbi:MAG: GTPase HflX, partial [Firmicutes bacterium]|nr:GTPase HflX [Bacillota bacterium]
TAGGIVVGRVMQNRARVDAEFFVGSGKVQEIREFSESNDAELIVFNNQLSGRQIKNLVDALDVSVIDRNMLILDIFAMRAQSLDGKLQVELAQLNYTLPRLTGQGVLMDRQEGAIGTRGPGETKLELDKRVIRRKIVEKKREIEKLAMQREWRRKKRVHSEKNVVIVGYTNAGKSTLMNAFTKAGVEVEDKLFATLDTTTRKVFHEIGKEYTLTDTVGFISDLPHEFIKAFKSTLEEAKYADLLLHVVDISSEQVENDIQIATSVLEEIGATNKLAIIVFNKIDSLKKQFPIKNNEKLQEIINEKINGINEIHGVESVAISAKTGEGIGELKNVIIRNLWK